ncbi:MAG: YtxH domain-containing protein [bacterium]|nr:YtxH domain-containing protein [bacterium]
MRSSGETVVAFLVGVAVGASLGLLMAPQAGEKTRRQIRRKAEDVQGQLEELGEELIEKGRDLIERGKQTADETISRVRQATS